MTAEVHRSVLLTVSGTMPDDLAESIAAGRRPRADYLVMRDAFGADLADVGAALRARGRIGRMFGRRMAGPLLGWHVFGQRNRYDVIVTDGEQAGLPLAVLTRLFGRGRARHMMIVHTISPRKKRLLVRLGRLASQVDHYVVYCSAQRDVLCDELGIPADRITVSPFMVDTQFFDPDRVPTEQRRAMICTAGLERRDYPTLLSAVRGMEVEVVIAAASPWSRRTDSTEGQDIPPNVTVCKLDLAALRDEYGASRFVVMPLLDVDFQAGITTILEAMSMERPVVVTRTPGQTDTIEDGVTGVYVPAADPAAFREAIVELLADPARVERMGAAARRWAVEHADVERYAARLAGLVDQLCTTDR